MPSSGLMTSIRSLRARFSRRREDVDLRDTADFLAGVPLFASLSRTMLVHLAEAVHHRSYRRDEFVYYQGDPAIGLFVIRSGSVRILVEGSGGSLHEIRVAGDGEVLGVEGVLGDGNLRRRESAQSIADARLMGIFSPDYRTLRRRHPKTGCAVSSLFARYAATWLSEMQRLAADRHDAVAAASLAGDAGDLATANFRQNQGL